MTDIQRVCRIVFTVPRMCRGEQPESRLSGMLCRIRRMHLISTDPFGSHPADRLRPLLVRHDHMSVGPAPPAISAAPLPGRPTSATHSAGPAPRPPGQDRHVASGTSSRHQHLGTPANPQDGTDRFLDRATSVTSPSTRPWPTRTRTTSLHRPRPAPLHRSPPTLPAALLPLRLQPLHRRTPAARYS